MHSAQGALHGPFCMRRCRTARACQQLSVQQCVSAHLMLVYSWCPRLQSAHERAKDLHAEAEGLLEEVLNNAEGRVGYPPPKPKARRSRSAVVSQDEKVRLGLTSLHPVGFVQCSACQANHVADATLGPL